MRERTPTLEAGRLRHRVTLQRQTRAQDPLTGQITTTWAEAFGGPVWAAVEPLSAREFVASQEPQSKVVSRVTIRYREGVDATMRVVHRGRVYNIVGVLEDLDSGREYLTLPVSEGVNDAGSL